MGLVISRDRAVSSATVAQRSTSATDVREGWPSFDTPRTIRMFRAAHRVVRRRSVAEEIAQDVILSAWQSGVASTRHEVPPPATCGSRHATERSIGSAVTLRGCAASCERLTSIERTVVWEMLLAPGWDVLSRRCVASWVTRGNGQSAHPNRSKDVGVPAPAVRQRVASERRGRLNCRLPATWDRVVVGFASHMGPLVLPVVGPP